MHSEILYKWTIRFLNPELRGFSTFIEKNSPGFYDEHTGHLLTLTPEEVGPALEEFDQIMSSMFLAFLQEQGISYSDMVAREFEFEKDLEPKVWAEEL